MCGALNRLTKHVPRGCIPFNFRMLRPPLCISLHPTTTHFSALPIGHKHELCNTLFAYEPPIESSTHVAHADTPHAVVMAVSFLTPAPVRARARTTALLASLVPLIPALLAQHPPYMPCGRLAIMQSDGHAHALYAEHS